MAYALMDAIIFCQVDKHCTMFSLLTRGKRRLLLIVKLHFHINFNYLTLNGAVKYIVCR